MLHQEAIEVLKTINEMYPKFNLTKRKAAMLLPNLKEMDYPGVMRNLSLFIMQNPYPPMLSEIAAYPEVEDSHIEEMMKWHEEAEKVPPEVKKQFLEEFDKLVQKKAGK
ncbi:hypothetical protein [Oceanobacillus chungangensis]|uniref:Replicative helicase inhibitor G39P N-terminal domain-containing protein n=1 Tax=Oceanobacillus chungangensis TaxID=1229152 RepID=A0A3D8PXR0_9BACI|nr:hypothetical protein [Oceanobacillus chungangensis]RDW19675.1 hypothetical protein CWR45_06240 [Oceanobacillus chungangensis]